MHCLQRAACPRVALRLTCGAYLCCRYNASSRHYDAFFLQSLPYNLTGLPTEGQLPGSRRGMAADTSSQAVQQAAASGWGGSQRLDPARAAQLGQRPSWQVAGAGAGPAEVQYSVLANQTAIHGLPAAISQASAQQSGLLAHSGRALQVWPRTVLRCCLPAPPPAGPAHLPNLNPPLPGLQVHRAILRWVTGDQSASISATSHPLPVLSHEQDMRITEAAGEWIGWMGM